MAKLYPIPKLQRNRICSLCPNKFPFSNQANCVKRQDGCLEAVLFLKVSLLHVPFIYAHSSFDFPSAAQ